MYIIYLTTNERDDMQINITLNPDEEKVLREFMNMKTKDEDILKRESLSKVARKAMLSHMRQELEYSIYRQKKESGE